MSETFPVQQPLQEQAPVFIPIERWARENGKEGLLGHIESAAQTYANIGVDKEKFHYSPESKSVRITVPLEDFHVGHAISGVKIGHGGIAAFLVDAASGALSFTVGVGDETPVTLNNSIDYLSPMIIREGDLEITSQFEEKPNGSIAREMHVVTKVTQNGKLCVVGRSTLVLIRERTLQRAVRE
jgi:acyl-coenzyme A thioesterase PaaI-like protein